MRGIPIFTFVQQARPLRARAARADGRAREGARHPRLPDELADRHAGPSSAASTTGARRRCTSSPPKGRHGETEVAERVGAARLARDRAACSPRPSSTQLRRGHRAARHRRRRVLAARRATRGSSSPMFFGSAMTNFGVRPFLDAFLELAPAARGPRRPTRGLHRADATAKFSRLRLQDPGEHGPVAPRPHRVPARRVAASTCKGMSALPLAAGQGGAARQAQPVHGGGAHRHRRRLARRRHRPVRPRPVPHRRHAGRRASASSSRACRASRPSTSRSCAPRTRCGASRWRRASSSWRRRARFRSSSSCRWA